MKRNADVVSASEIASWAWCPESWRLTALGHEPGNRTALERGVRSHASRAAYERTSRAAVSVGWWLVAAAVLLVVVTLVLAARG